MNPKKKKTLLIVSGAVILVFLSGLVILTLSIGSIVKSAVNNVLPRITGTDCGMASCTFNPFSGTVSIGDFHISNPQGYTHPYAFRVGHMYVQVSPSSLLSDKIIVRSIIIDDLEASLEAKLTETNITAIKKNVDNSTRRDSQAPDEKPAPDSTKSDDKPPKKLQIDLFKFVNSQLVVGALGHTAKVPIPDIIIQDIGQNEQGATPAEIANRVFYALYEAIVEASKNSSVKISDSVKEGTGRVMDTVKGIFGGSSGEDKTE